MKKQEKITIFPRITRQTQLLLHLFVDFILLGFLSALMLLDDSSISDPAFIPTLIFYVGLIIVKLAILSFTGIYRIITSHFSMIDAMKVGIVSIATTLAAYVVMVLVPAVSEWSVMEFIVLAFAEAFLLISVRFAKRMLHMYVVRKDRTTDLKPTLIIGAGLGGKMIIDEIRNNHKMNNDVVAIIDDDINKIGSSFSGVRVYGPISRIHDFIKKYNVVEVIIAIANLDKKRLYEILTYMDQENVKIKRYH